MPHLPAAPREPDPDPDGAKLAATADPLGEAAKLVAVLVKSAADRLQVGGRGWGMGRCRLTV